MGKHEGNSTDTPRGLWGGLEYHDSRLYLSKKCHPRRLKLISMRILKHCHAN